MKTITQLSGKILYGFIFTLIIPCILFFWAKYTEGIVRLPVIESKIFGMIMTIGGGLLMLSAMHTLIKYGKGLPMNAYPPPVFVNKGPYKLFAHPIYWGFSILMIGYFIYIGSASGFWMVSPITILGLIALVWGHENIDLKKRFPDKKIITILDLPEKEKRQPSLINKIASLFWVTGLLFLSNFLILNRIGNITIVLSDPFINILNNDLKYLRFLSLGLIIIVPFIIKQNDSLREWIKTGIIAFMTSAFVTFLYPVIGAQYFPLKYNLLFTVPVFILLLSLKSILKQSKTTGYFLGIIILFSIIIQLSISRSPLLHLFSSFLIFLFASNYLRIWLLIRNIAEKIANSWKEWVIGKIRIINHGFYVGFGSFFGIMLCGILLGDKYAWAILVFAVIVIVFSALWAQVIEGSEKLKRPYGYYGALVGIIFASLAVWLMGFNVWTTIGIISVFMPWVQAIGRLRCLINGCCHGGKVNNTIVGIRYFHYRSRVCGISGLKGELLHPTPIYSILWLFIIGFVLLALWNNNHASPFIFGLYLILTGIGRFVEEAYRGEVQTPIVKGLRLYQWTAIATVIIGIVMTTIRINTEILPSTFGWETALSAFIGGLFTTFAMGVDFPYSNARFSRLV